MSDIEEPFLIDQVEVICNGCGSKRIYPVSPPWTKAQEFIDWQRAGSAEACDCGAPTADMKLRLAKPN